MSGPGASRALVMKKLPPMVAERKLSRPAASNGASPCAAEKYGLDPEIFTVQRAAGRVGEFGAAQKQIADDARRGQRHFAERLEPIAAGPAEIDVAADNHRARVQRGIAAAVDERALEAHITLDPRAVQANDAVHRGSAPARWSSIASRPPMRALLR